MRYLIPFAMLMLGGFNSCLAQSTVYVRNSTWQDFNVEIAQSGTVNMDSAQWTVQDTLVRGWIETTGQPVLTVNRNNDAVAEGDTAYFDIRLSGASDTLTMNLRIVGVAGSTELAYSAVGNSFSEPWYDDGDFHEVATTLNGKNVVIKFKPDNDDSGQNRDIRYALHDLPIYHIDSADFQNPDVMNVMYYNIQMLPFGVSGMGQANDRADLLPAQISEYEDAVSFAEAFDNTARESHLIPAMTAAGFLYHTAILNDPGLIPLPWNGGVIIFSRWPIETEAEIDYQFCGQASQDCLANKGVKYARINKLGKRYHVFGTHMDAGGQADDIHARRTQMAEIRDMIADLDIPESEPVIFGGDFNIDPPGSDNDYQAFLDTMSPIIPQHLGYWESNFNGDFGKIIDHAWGDRTHLVPGSITNKVITIRSLEPPLWDISEFSDHRCILGRFTYQDISKIGGDTLICPGESITLSVSTAYPVTYQWSKDGQELNGETTSTLEISNALQSQSGHYICLVSYDVIYGDWPDSLDALFFPQGIDTVEARLNFDFGDVMIDDMLCHVGVQEMDETATAIFPNPASGRISFHLPDATGPVAVRMYNIHGKKVVNSQIAATGYLDVSTLAKGLYLIDLDTGSARYTQRIVIHR